MPITYTPITDVVEVTGYSEITPCDLETIRLADVAGTWGQVTKQGSDQYLINAHLNVGADIQTIELLAAGYLNCVATDIGKMVEDDGWERGVLRSYDNTTRIWEITTLNSIGSGSAMTIPLGSGGGTTTGVSILSHITGWFAEEAKQLVMGNRREININAEGHARFGECLDVDEATTANSCSIMMDLTNAGDKFRLDGELEMYGCVFLNSTRGSGMFYLSPDLDTNIVRLWNCYISEIGYVYEYGAFGPAAKNWVRGTISNNLTGINLTTGIFPPEHFNDTLIQGCDDGVRCTWLGYYGNEEVSVRNLWIKDSQVDDFECFNWGSAGYTADFYAIDAVCDWVILWSGSSTEADLSKLHRQYSFNLKVVDEYGIPVDNVRGRCWDKDLNLLFTVYTNASGVITEQIIEYGHYRPTQEVRMNVAGYADCVSTDIGKQVHIGAADIGELIDYDNVTRTWKVSERSMITSGSVCTITGGDGAGTLSADSTSITFLNLDGPHILKFDKTGYNDINYVGDINGPVNWTLTLTDPCYPWTVDEINAVAASGYDHSAVANYPMSWSGATIMVWGDDGSGGKEAMGYDDDNPIELEHVWAFAAYTKGTCIIEKGADGAFTLKKPLIIGDGTATTFMVSEKEIAFIYDYFKIKNVAQLRMGTIKTDAQNPAPDPRWGAKWNVERYNNPGYFVESGGTLKGYDSQIYLTKKGFQSAFDTQANSTCDFRYFTLGGESRQETTYCRFWGDVYFDHWTVHHVRNLNFPHAPDPTSHHLIVYDNTNNVQVRDGEIWLYDATLINPITCTLKVLKFAGYDPGRCNMVDPDGFDNTKVCSALQCWAKLWHRFARRVKDENGDPIVGARVQLWNIGGSPIYDKTTDVQGWTVMELVKEWQTKDVSGQPLSYPSQFDLEGPFTVKISKDGTGYLTIEEELEIDERMDTWEVTMVDVSDIIEDLDDIKGTGFVKDTHSLVNIVNGISGIAAAVWGHGTRTLSAFSTALAVSVWNVLESAISLAQSIGLKVKTNLDETVSSRAPANEYNTILSTIAIDVEGLDGDGMRGTDGAYTGTPPTVLQIREEIEKAGTKLTEVKIQTDKMNFSGDNIQARVADKGVLNDVSVEGLATMIIEGAITFREAQRAMLATLAGRSDGAETEVQHFRDTQNIKNRVTGIIDGDGNRIGITLDLSD